MKCEEVREELALLLYEELSFEREEAVRRHLGECAGCLRVLERERALHEVLDAAEVEPRADMLAGCRRDLRERLAAVVQPGPLRKFWSGLARPFGRPWMKPVAALALIALGFFGSRTTQDGLLWRHSSEPVPGEAVASQVRYLQPEAASGKVRIVLDETRQRVVTGSPDDARIQRLLLSAARESTDPELRVVAMDVLKSRTRSGAVRNTMLQVLQDDPDPGVRLEALDGLRSFPADTETRGVLSKVLFTDDNPRVRIQAIDLLTQRREAEVAGVLQELLDRESNHKVRVRCQKALRDMNASVETF